MNGTLPCGVYLEVVGTGSASLGMSHAGSHDMASCSLVLSCQRVPNVSKSVGICGSAPVPRRSMIPIQVGSGNPHCLVLRDWLRGGGHVKFYL